MGVYEFYLGKRKSRKMAKMPTPTLSNPSVTQKKKKKRLSPYKALKLHSEN